MVKTHKGFTLVELIVVIAVLAILAIGAIFTLQGIQANARRSILISDTTALVTAVNAANATAATRGGTLFEPANIPSPVIAGSMYRITLTVAAGNGLEAEIFNVDFDTEKHATRAVSAMTFIPPPTDVTGAPGSFIVASGRIATWGSSQDDPVIP